MDEQPIQTTEDNQGGATPSISSETPKVDWVEKAILYEATPKRLREPKTDSEFIAQLGIPRSTYYYEMAKKENEMAIIDICFKQAKKRTPEVLDSLGQKAVEGNDKSQEMFMEYVLELKKKMDVTSNNKTIGIPILNGISQNALQENISTNEDTQSQETSEDNSGRV